MLDLKNCPLSAEECRVVAKRAEEYPKGYGASWHAPSGLG
jgi:hypothetical protein